MLYDLTPMPVGNPLTNGKVQGFGGWTDFLLMDPFTAVFKNTAEAVLEAQTAPDVPGVPHKGVVESAAEGFGGAIGKGISTAVIGAVIIGALYLLLSKERTRWA